MGETYNSFESFYGGAGSAFDPDSSNSFTNFNKDVFVGYQLSPSQIGFSTNPMTSDQLGELQRGIRSGAKVVEVNLLRIQGQEQDQQVPKEHFAEMRALSKLTGVSPSIHGPLIDAAGFNEQQGVWSEENRKNNERIMIEAMEKASWADPDKDIPVVFHSSNMLGAGTHYKPGKEKADGTQEFVEEIVPLYNRETKQLVPVSEKTHYKLGGQGDKFKEKIGIDETMANQNAVSWDNEIKNLTMEKKAGDELLDSALASYQGLVKMRGEKPYEGMDENEAAAQRAEVERKIAAAHTILQNNRRSFSSLFNQAYEHGTKKQKEELRAMSDQWAEDEKKYVEEAKGEERILNSSRLQDGYLRKLEEITSERVQVGPDGKPLLNEKGKPILDENYGAPKVFVRGEAFAMEEAAKTFGNVATESYNRFGKEKAPVVAIENVWNGAMFSRGEDMKELVEKSRDVMAENLVKKGMDSKKARKMAEEKIGMNFDVGHMNMFRKKGFTTEDMAAQVKEFAPYVKHMHLTDNFGFSDEHLYPGQGNVPFKEFFTELAKGNPTFDKDTKKIVETGGVESRHMQGRSAHAFNLAAFGVPIFGGDYWAGPTFDAAINTFGNYSSGYGEVNPQVHHSMYGAGFSGLPPEVGGIIPGMAGGGSGQSRFGGTPMA